jgi:hypothetical protein
MADPAAEVTAAVIAGLISLVGIIASAAMTSAKLGSAERQAQAKLSQESERLRREFQLEFAAETAARALLDDPRWKLRTFDTIKRHLGGFEDDELRKLLVRAGAIRFRGPEGEELWGLLDRNKDALGRAESKAD